MLKRFLFKKMMRISRLNGDFRLINALIFILAAFNIYYKIEWTDQGFASAFNLWNPSWLLFGPLFYCSYMSLANKPIHFSLRQSLHLIPFVICVSFYLIISFTVDLSDNPWNSMLFTTYQNSFLFIALSLVPYSLYVLSRILLVNTHGQPDGDALILTIGVIFLLISVLVTLMFLSWGFLHIDMGMDYRFLSYGLLALTCIAILWYWVAGDKEWHTRHTELQLNSYKNSAISEQLALIYKNQLMDYFDNSAAYLEANLSLDSLSKELSIPKHHFSQLFSIHLATSFHNFVADYRISHAIQLLQDNKGRLKIESLAYSCGFNSKTSFNKYFKDKTGLTPSEYQIQLAAKQYTRPD